MYTVLSMPPPKFSAGKFQAQSYLVKVNPIVEDMSWRDDLLGDEISWVVRRI